MFRSFETLHHPYPQPEPALPPKEFFAFVWACTTGLRGYIGWLALLSASVSVLKHQTLAINFPLRLRWNFHRLMLGQSKTVEDEAVDA